MSATRGPNEDARVLDEIIADAKRSQGLQDSIGRAQDAIDLQRGRKLREACNAGDTGNGVSARVEVEVKVNLTIAARVYAQVEEDPRTRDHPGLIDFEISGASIEPADVLSIVRQVLDEVMSSTGARRAIEAKI